MEPSFHLASSDTPSTKNDTSQPVVSQTWQRNGRFCPKGTIPIRRIRRKDLLIDNNSLERFGKKNQQAYLATTNTTKNDGANVDVYVNDTRVAFASQVNRSVRQQHYKFLLAFACFSFRNVLVSLHLFFYLTVFLIQKISSFIFLLKFCAN